MDKALALRVQTRAGGRCEYCLLPQSAREFRFQIDHIIARQHRGETTMENLALCCGRCNLHKGTNLAGIDFLSGQMSRLFHPRHDIWKQNFQWDGVIITGITPVGRATVTVLKMNDVLDLAVRAELSVSGIFPSDE